ncbi:P-loop containing nucleoside triphosphate hydrolase protein [Lepidopterella palustris CBS 459.81]|uniref:RNA helicase n=1 Tax=Lepidopterella palustris CBS 459.81 TaxID=1314670 RepID=A0A8E2E6X0_9PEZI|nr:P-loop containing nucleoside triphosphate hydrolase protein [Lepidopterella palustris CBS 459.81]
MPERVYTRFDDDDVPSSKPSKPSVTSDKPPAPSQGKKRKRGELQSNPAPEKKASKLLADHASCAKTQQNSGNINGVSRSGPPQQNGIPRNGPGRDDKNGHGHGHGQHGQHGHLSKKREILLPLRKALPIWPHAEEIKAGLRGSKDVMLLTGETGSGKSTQVPQFLLDEPWCKGCIAITQPRRVAAISLARRVAEEMGSLLGSLSPASKVGYSVRFDNSTSPNTRIKFLTEGMLLQEMLRDPWLNQYSAVIVDEVHERSVNVDLLLGFLRNLVTGDKKGRNGKPLKVVIMSATADIESLFKFFDEGFQKSLNTCQKAKGDHTQTNGANDSDSSWSGIASSEDENSKKALTKKSKPNGVGKSNGERSLKRKENPSISPEPIDLTSDFMYTCYIEGRQYPVKIMYLPEPTQDFVEAALKSIFQIHYKEPLPGDILVFLTGQDTVEALERLVNEYALGMDTNVPKLLALPLFAALPQSAQQRIFHPSPPKTRKIILSTNIAETSVTVPGVRYVIDSGKVKIKQFRNRLGLDSLLVKPVSQSAAIQRKGRAGREAPGVCYRLYTEKDFVGLEKRTVPEILRCDLSGSLLTMKARGVDDIFSFPFLDRPPREALEKALLQLLQLGALTETGGISEVGLQLAKLPLTPTLGRVIVEAAKPERDCLLEIIDIIACLSVENIFLNLITEEKKEAAEEARRELYRREGDHMTLLTTVQAYAKENSDRKSWAERHFISHRAMQNVMDIRKQLRQQCTHLKLLHPSKIPLKESPAAPSEAQTNAILHSLLRGFAANTARLMPDGSYRTMLGNQTVAIHPASVMFGRKVEAIVFSEFVFTNKSYARGVSGVQLGWVGDVLGSMG